MGIKTGFYLLTDAHYVSPKNWVEGLPFTRRERGDQIALKATPQILDAFIDKVLADDAVDTVLFTVVDVYLALQELIASENHCRFHLPHEESVVYIHLACHIFLHGKIESSVT